MSYDALQWPIHANHVSVTSRETDSELRARLKYVSEPYRASWIDSLHGNDLDELAATLNLKRRGT